MLSSVSKTIAAAGNYTSGDVVSEDAGAGLGTAWRFRGIPNLVGNGVIIESAVLTCDEDSLTATYRLHLFNANPSGSELDDNEALNIVAADRTKYLGFITFGAMVDRGVISTAQLLNVQLHAVPDAGDSSLYGVLEDTSGET